MGLVVENGIWRSVFAVPAEIVDSHLRLAGETQLKTLLAVLRYGGGIDAQALCQVCGKTLPDILDALEFWRERGVIVPEGEEKPSLRYDELPAPIAQAPAEPPNPEPAALEPVKTVETAPDGQKITTVSSRRRRLDRLEIAELAEKDENVAALLQETQAALGKTLNAVAIDTVVSLYSYYGLAPDLILMLIHYCVSTGKDSLSYIEKTASSWVESGITTHEKAEAEILRSTKSNENEKKVRAAFGVFDRALIASEKKYIRAWFEEWRFDTPMITLAYERCVEMNAKLSFPYINGILKNWHGKNIRTPMEASRETRDETRRPAAASNPRKPAEQAASYSLDELEKLIDQGPY